MDPLLASVAQHTTAPYEVVLVEDLAEAKEAAPPPDLLADGAIRRLQFDMRAGVSAARNAGAGLARAEEVMFLDADTLVAPGWLEGLRAALHAGERIAAVGPRSNHANGAQGGVWLDDLSASGIRRIAEAFTYPDPSRRFEVGRLDEFALLVTHEAFDAAGGFSDPCGGAGSLTQRILESGRRALCAGDTFVFRAGAKLSARDRPEERSGRGELVRTGRGQIFEVTDDRSSLVESDAVLGMIRDGREVRVASDADLAGRARGLPIHLARRTDDGTVHLLRAGCAYPIVGDRERIRRLPLVSVVEAGRLDAWPRGKPVEVEDALEPVSVLAAVLPDNPARIHADALAGADAVFEGITRALQSGHGYSVIRLSSGEILSINNGAWPVEGFSLSYAGRGLMPGHQLSQRLVDAARQADVVGVQERRDLFYCAPLLEHLAFHHDLYPPIRCSSDINFHLIGVEPSTGATLGSSPLHALMRDQRLAVVGRRGPEAHRRATELDLNISVAVPIESVDQIDEAFKRLASRREDFDAVLLAAGLASRILAPMLARELGVVALDLGHALDRLLNPGYRTAAAPMLKKRWWMTQYVATLNDPAPCPPHQHEGHLVRPSGGKRVFLIERGRLRPLLHREHLSLFDHKPVEVDASVIADLPEGAPICIVRESLTGPYVLVHGRKHRVSPLLEVVQLDDLTLAQVPDGEDFRAWPGQALNGGSGHRHDAPRRHENQVPQTRVSLHIDGDGAVTSAGNGGRAIYDESLALAQRELADTKEQLRQAARNYDKAMHKVGLARTRGRRFRQLLIRTLEALNSVRLPEIGEDAPTAAAFAPVLADAGALRGAARLADELARGCPLDESVVLCVRDLLDARDHVRARSLSQALLRVPATADAGQLGCVLVNYQQRLFDIAWQRARCLAPDLLRRLVPAEYIALAFKGDKPLAINECLALLSDPAPAVCDRDWLTIARAGFAHREHALSRELLDALDRRTDGKPDLTEDETLNFTCLHEWARRTTAPAPKLPPGPRGEPVFGVLSYRQPDRRKASTNVGDYVQTLASLGHLVRHADVDFGGDELGHYVQELKDRVRPDRRVSTHTTRAHVVSIDRDFSSHTPLPPDTWTIAFGWYMHRVLDEYCDFPLHSNIRPIFISFHVNRREMLTDDAVEYLRRYAPIGCRDWSTVYLLHGFGIPAFFSGCITTTIDLLYSELDHVIGRHDRLPCGVVDVKAGTLDFTRDEPWEAVSQARPRVRDDSTVVNLRAADALLDSYRRSYGRIVTSRLHCYLPATALGVDVDFRPRNPTDVRFEGLVGLKHGDHQLRRMQIGILDKLQAVVEAILAGRCVDDVYATWRSVCAPDVQRASERLARRPPRTPPSIDVDATCQVIRDGRRDFGPRDDPSDPATVHIAVSLDENFLPQLPVVVESIVASTNRHVHFWVTERGLAASEMADVAGDFPEATMTFLPCDAVDYGEIRGMLRHITMAVMDRLLLPLLLPDVRRCIFHDLDAITIGDIGELFDTDLGDAPVAARLSELPGSSAGFDHVYRAAARLDDPSISAELRRRMHARWPGDYPAFNAGVMVLDLEQMRADNFCTEFVPFAERYGMNDQEVMSCYAGPRVAWLPPEWNYWPKQDVVDRPKLIHWAGLVKPWHAEYTLDVEEWLRVERQWLARRERHRRASANASTEFADAQHVVQRT